MPKALDQQNDPDIHQNPDSYAVVQRTLAGLRYAGSLMDPMGPLPVFGVYWTRTGRWRQARQLIDHWPAGFAGPDCIEGGQA